jgi:hypothetical protein
LRYEKGCDAAFYLNGGSFFFDPQPEDLRGFGHFARRSDRLLDIFAIFF